MKKLTLMFLAILPLVACQAKKAQPIEFSALPTKAQEFIKTHFPSKTISVVFYDNEVFDKDYEVRFSDGTDIDFDSKGEWKSIEMKGGDSVPETVIPKEIKSYLNSKHPNTFVVDINKEKRKYEVELNNSIDIVFDKNGKFKHYDD